MLLLNTVLTVRDGQAASHAGRGWERFTGVVIAAVSAGQSPVVFMLWGARAQLAGKEVDRTEHIVLESSHPSPLSWRRSCADSPPFLGSRPFSSANRELQLRGLPPIDWSLTEA